MLGITAWVMLVLERPEIEQEDGWSALAIELGVFAAIWLYLVAQWLLTERGYFWPAWVLLGLGVAAGIHAAVVFGRREYACHGSSSSRPRAPARSTCRRRARRIERDLHDGAQARLVALGMSIGMAEEKLATDPEGARVLLAEARTGAREALEELRDLARGIHPPILTDRGLNPAIQALVARTPARRGRLGRARRAAAPAGRDGRLFRRRRGAGERRQVLGRRPRGDRRPREDGILVAEVRDDGSGGADPAGKGLTGLRRRVEALDGSLQVSSPAGAPTTVRAELPCGS